MQVDNIIKHIFEESYFFDDICAQAAVEYVKTQETTRYVYSWVWNYNKYETITNTDWKDVWWELYKYWKTKRKICSFTYNIEQKQTIILEKYVRKI